MDPLETKELCPPRESWEDVQELIPSPNCPGRFKAASLQIPQLSAVPITL